MSRSDAKAVIDAAVMFISAAADRLNASKFSDTAISRFRGTIAGQLRSVSRRLVEIAWADGNGQGETPYTIATDYFNEQAGFLGDFVIAISENRGNRKIPGGSFRAAMYGESLGQCYQKAYFKARGSRVGLPDLPAYPRDGSTVCLTNCRCTWVIKRVSQSAFTATWKLGAAEHCPDCITRGRVWNPISIVRVLSVNDAGDKELGDWQMTDATGAAVN